MTFRAHSHFCTLGAGYPAASCSAESSRGRPGIASWHLADHESAHRLPSNTHHGLSWGV